MNHPKVAFESLLLVNGIHSKARIPIRKELDTPRRRAPLSSWKAVLFCGVGA